MADQKITDLTADATPSVDDLILTVDSPGGTPVNKKVTIANLLFSLSRFTFKYATRDETAANGNVGYTGSGFTPKAVIIIANTSNTDRYSWGTYDGSNYATIMRFSTTSSSASTSEVVYIGDGASWSEVATVASLDSNGVTLTWTKSGSPAAGTINLIIIYLR